ncbi:MORC family CW-type zinc finger protein 4 isoform X2 [Grus americana]|uniref:MORC family CW-type zinc finger protein 4 isoform X2 n=1 Tax=Grus americana TaxID=9117 RepID=UPI0024086D8A|nr:MORC family CW-type zinc finger protein 4 isoform X2 [Grus americana]
MMLRAQAACGCPLAMCAQDNEKTVVTEDSVRSLEAILDHSVFNFREELPAEFDAVPEIKMGSWSWILIRTSIIFELQTSLQTTGVSEQPRGAQLLAGVKPRHTQKMVPDGSWPGNGILDSPGKDYT